MNVLLRDDSPRNPLLQPLTGEEMLLLSRGPEMRSYEPTLRERVGNRIYDAASAVGLGSQANRMRDEGTIAADFLPGIGDAIAFDDAGAAYGRGDYGQAAILGGLGAIGVIPGAGPAIAKGAKEAGRRGIRAFHGSPHDFDRFDISKIGTGEGAQAYGHGLYFAESEDVARSYRDALRFPRVDGVSSQSAPVARVTDDLNYQRGNVDALRKTYEGMLERGTPEAQKMARENLAVLDDVNASNPGHMYEVNINADPAGFLDFDGTIGGQPQAVRDYLSRYDATGNDRFVANALQQVDITRGDGRMTGFSPRTSEELLEAGVPGIKYLDAGSRGAADGSRNYVVFDPAIIEIVRKYGLAGALGAGLITEEMARQMSDQGMGEL